MESAASRLTRLLLGFILALLVMASIAILDVAIYISGWYLASGIEIVSRNS